MLVRVGEYCRGEKCSAPSSEEGLVLSDDVIVVEYVVVSTMIMIMKQGG
jgi:hypothetical protein